MGLSGMLCYWAQKSHHEHYRPIFIKSAIVLLEPADMLKRGTTLGALERPGRIAGAYARWDHVVVVCFAAEPACHGKRETWHVKSDAAM